MQSLSTIAEYIVTKVVINNEPHNKGGLRQRRDRGEVPANK
jgi:hypothetical protein